MEKTEVGILNQVQRTYYSRQYGFESAIDIAFVDIPSLVLYNWSVEPDSWGTDHFPIYITLNARSELKTSFRSIRLTNSKTDCELIGKNLENWIDQCSEIISNTNIDIRTKYTTFLAIITDCIHYVNPITNNTNNKNKKEKKDQYQNS